MADYTTIARPYARAVFELAQAQKAFSEWSTLLGFMAAVAQDATVERLLVDPKLPIDKRIECLLALCKDQINKKIKKSSESFVRLLADNQRLYIIPDVAKQYEQYRAAAESTIEATIVAPQAVSKDQQKSIAGALEKRLGKKVALETEIDETIIGGAVIKAGDLVIDGSIKGQLGKLTTALLR